jgi:release factor glutamine methyltransferase
MMLFEVLKGSADCLKDHRVENPRLNAELLLAQCLGFSRETLYANLRREILAEEKKALDELLRRRMAGEPLQYLLGHQEFWSVDLKVDPRVLIPRPETEVLVEEALSILAIPSGSVPRVLDIGTGSGAIVIALTKEVEEIFAVATDISHEALEVAKENAREAGVDQRIRFVRGNLLHPFRHLTGGVFDLILSNPPYICRSEIEELTREIKGHEPRLALDGGEDGLDFYHQMSRQVPPYLREGGWLLVEIGQGQGAKISALLEQSGCFRTPELVRDLSGIERVIKVQKAER